MLLRLRTWGEVQHALGHVLANPANQDRLHHATRDRGLCSVGSIVTVGMPPESQTWI